MHDPPEWSMDVPEILRNNITCDVWTPEEEFKFNQRLGCTCTVDEDGFFVHFLSPDRGGEVIEICQISDVRPVVTKDSKSLSQMNNHYTNDLEWHKRTFTVCSGGDLVNVNYHHFVCPDAQIAKDWREALLSITHNTRFNNVCVWMNLRKHWKRLCLSCDPNGNISPKGVIETFASGKAADKEDISKVLKNLHIVRPDEPAALSPIKPCDFSFGAFYNLYRALCPREDVDELFSSIAGNDSDTIDGSKFAKFLNEYQRDARLNEILHRKIKVKDAEKVILKYEPNDEARKKKRMTVDGLIRYLMSDATSAIQLGNLKVYMNMDQPLAHYYINSSHNTYLIGRQWRGKSSVEMYRQVLLTGCRCIELDCHDGEDGEPMITHGKALCTVIPFKDVINAIRDTAFITSEYPVILSFENHCSKSQQLVMAKYCEEIFQDKLLKEPLPGFPLDPGRVLPSPSALKGKILIKNKRLPPEKEKLEYDKYLKRELRKNRTNVLENTEEEEEEQNSMKEDGIPESTGEDEEEGHSDARVKKEEGERTIGDGTQVEASFTHKSGSEDCQTNEKYKPSESEEFCQQETPTKSNGSIGNGSMEDVRPVNRNPTPAKAMERCTEEANSPDNRTTSQRMSESHENVSEAPSEVSTDTVSSLAKCDSQQSFSNGSILKAMQYRNSVESGSFSGDASEYLELGGFADGLERKARSLPGGDPQSPPRQNLIALHKKDSRTSQSSFTSSSHENTFSERSDSKYGLDSHRDANEVAPPPEIPHTSSTTNVHPYLSRMINYAQSIKFQSFQDSERKNIHHHMSSFNEITGVTMINQHPIDFVNYNKRQMSRIFPKGLRLDSSNFWPHTFWNAGCHMVALNFQTADSAMQLNQGKFEFNGNCGYLLKPEPMRTDRDFNLSAKTSVDGVIAAQCSVQVLSGQFLSDKKLCTYVQVEMYGLQADTRTEKEFRTSVVPDNGLNPRYDHQPFCFRKIMLPDLALLRFVVYEEGGRLLWQRVIPLNSLQPGYRHITLRTEGNFSTALPSLFCFIQFADYVPSIHQGFVDQLDSIVNKDSKEVRGMEQRRQDSEQEWSSDVLADETRSLVAEDVKKDERKMAESSTQLSNRAMTKKGSKSEMEVKEVAKFADITVSVLMKDNKHFAKLVRKQEEKLRRLREEHLNQLDNVMKKQCRATTKLQSPKRKHKPKSEAEAPSFWEKQVNQWSELKERQRSEEVLMRENHVKARFEMLERMMKDAQARQIGDLKTRHSRETKEMTSKQAKTSMKTIAEVKDDASLRNKFDKESCILEKKEQMTKVFADERRQFLKRQGWEMQKLELSHKDQFERLDKERAQALEKINNERRENDFAPIREFCA